MFTNLNNSIFVQIWSKLTSPFPGPIEAIIIIIIAGCILSILISVLISFINYDDRTDTKKEKKSFVETGSMLFFAFVFYLAIKFNLLVIENTPLILRLVLLMAGTILTVLGTYINVKGRSELGKYWANQIKIYEDHKLLTTGMFGIFRHPLYASLIMVFYGISLIYLNMAGVILNTFVFIPFMHYRAKQEEKLLSERFKEYNEYRKQVGLFFPKLWR